MRSTVLLWLAASAAFAAPRVTADRERVLLGQDRQITIRVESSAPLRASASSGTLEHAASEGGEQVFRWTPPDIRFPTRAVLLFWEAASPKPDVAVLELSLVGRTIIEMDTEPFADVRVQVAGTTFGPVKANARGRVKVPVEVPPGVRSAQAVAVAKGQRTSRTVSLDVPRTAPFSLAAGPTPLGPGSGWVMAQSSSAAPANVRARADGARLEQERGGAGRTIWRIVPNRGATSVQVTAEGADGERHVIALGASAAAEVISAEGGPPALIPQVLLGGFYCGGANIGPRVELGAALRPSAFPSWLSLDASTGVRTLSLSGNPGGLGASESSLWVLPIDVGARARIWRGDPLAIDVRVGAGALLFRHLFQTAFEPSFAETGVGFETYAAVDGAWQLGPIEAIAEVGGAFAQTRTPHLIARPGGLTVSLGASWPGQ